MAKKHFWSLDEERTVLDEPTDIFNVNDKIIAAQKEQERAYKKNQRNKKLPFRLLTLATIGGSAVYALTQQPDNFSMSFEGVAAVTTLGVINNAVRHIGTLAGMAIGGALSSIDDNAKNALQENDITTAKQTIRGYATTFGMLGGALALWLAAPKTIEFAGDKLVPLFSNNTKMVDQDNPSLLATMKSSIDFDQIRLLSQQPAAYRCNNI